MKKYLILFLAALAILSGCKKDNNGDANSFTATIEQSGAKTTLGADDGSGNRSVLWSSGDAISIDGNTYTTTANGTTTATFIGSGATGSTHHAYYPASLYNSTSSNYELPREQTYEEGKISNLPMYAESSTTNLVFKNLCGVLAITVPDSVMTSVDSIIVYSDQRMNGTISNINYDATSVTYSLSAASSYADKTVVLKMSSSVSISGDKTFYIAVPAQEYGSLAIIVAGSLTVTNGTVTAKIKESISPSMQVQRSKIYPITFSGTTPIRGTATVSSSYTTRTSCEWVRLWKNGPCFATCNLGADVPGDYGNYYAWGATSTQSDYDNSHAPYRSDNSYSKYNSSDSKTTLESTDDAAYVNWGSNWRMPTDAELCDNSTGLLQIIGVLGSNNGRSGRTFTGTGAYASNSIFLPFAGYYEGSITYGTSSYSYYWSSSLYTSSPNYA